jgi:dual oxidase maturation factor 1
MIFLAFLLNLFYLHLRYTLFRAAFTAWLLMNILLMVVPRYGAYTMVLTGVLMLSADLMYLWLLPDAPLQVRFEVGMLKFELGWCFWLTLIAGT